MVMVEAMACGTPVIAFPEGAAPEIVVDGDAGFLVDDEDEMAAAVGAARRARPARCRATVAERFDIDVVAAAYERRLPAGRSPADAGDATLARSAQLGADAASAAGACRSARVSVLRRQHVRRPRPPRRRAAGRASSREHGFFSEDTRFVSRWQSDRRRASHRHALGLARATLRRRSSSSCRREHRTFHAASAASASCAQTSRRRRLDRGPRARQPPPRASRPRRRRSRSTPTSPTCSRSRTAACASATMVTERRRPPARAALPQRRLRARRRRITVSDDADIADGTHRGCDAASSAPHEERRVSPAHRARCRTAQPRDGRTAPATVGVRRAAAGRGVRELERVVVRRAGAAQTTGTRSRHAYGRSLGDLAALRFYPARRPSRTSACRRPGCRGSWRCSGATA